MAISYELNIFDKVGGDAIYVFQSPQPFMTIQRGDILNPRGWMSNDWNSVYKPNDESKCVILKVIGFEHQIIQLADNTITRHLIMIYTQPVEDLEENRP